MPNRPKELDDPDRREVSATGYTRGAVAFNSTDDIDVSSCGIVFFDKCRHHPAYTCPQCGKLPPAE